MERLKGYNIGSKTRERMAAATSRYLDRIFKSSLLVRSLHTGFVMESTRRVDWPQGEKGIARLTLWILLRLLWESIIGGITDGISWTHLPTLFFIRGSPLSFWWLFYRFGSFVVVSRFPFVISEILLSFLYSFGYNTNFNANNI